MIGSERFQNVSHAHFLLRCSSGVKVPTGTFSLQTQRDARGMTSRAKLLRYVVVS